MGTPMTSPVRVPVGSLIAIAPHGAGKEAVLAAQLVAAGLPAASVVSREAARAKFGNQCTALGCRAVPSSCTHFEEQVDALIEAHATTFLAAGRTWMYDAPPADDQALRDHVTRAHRAGLAAVAMRRRGEQGEQHLPLEVCLENIAGRPRRVNAATAASAHARYAELTSDALYALGFDVVVDWDTSTTFELMPQSSDGRGIDTSKFVVVGDLHGCARTFFDALLPAVGTDKDLSNPDVVVVSVGDIHDKGADPQGSVDLIRWWMRAIRTGRALMVDSNHARSLTRHLTGQGNRVSPGLADTLAAIEAQDDAEQLKAEIVATFSRLPSHLWFDDLVVVHAGITEQMLGTDSKRNRGFMLHVRDAATPWEWTGTQTLVHGHEPVDAPHTRQAAPDPNRPGHTPGPVVNIDTGAYTGGGMTAYRPSTGEVITVPTAPGEAIDPAERTLELLELAPAATAAA